MIKKIKNYLLPRIKNYGFWTAIAALIPMALYAFGDVNVIPENYKEIVGLVLSLLVALGITNNPTTENRGYGDDK